MRYKVNDIDLSYQKDRNCGSLKINTLKGEYYPAVTTYYFLDNSDLAHKIEAEINSAIHYIFSATTSLVKAIAFKTSVVLSEISFIKKITSAIKVKTSVIEVISSAKTFAISVVQFTAKAIAFFITSFTSLFSVLLYTIEDTTYWLNKVFYMVGSNQIDVRLKGSYHFSDWFRKPYYN